MLIPILLSLFVSRVGLSAAPWTPLSMEFSRQEYWSGLPFPSPPWDQTCVSHIVTFPASAGGFFTPNATWEAPFLFYR